MHTVMYEQIVDFDGCERVRERYRADMSALSQLGFRELCFYREGTQPFSLVFFLPIFLLMRAKRELVQIQSPLRITAAYPLMASNEYSTGALILGLGIKFYTSFTDGSGLITANFLTDLIDDDRRQLYKYGAVQSTPDAWEQHRGHINQRKATGKRLREPFGFEDYVRLSKREEGQE